MLDKLNLIQILLKRRNVDTKDVKSSDADQSKLLDHVLEEIQQIKHNSKLGCESLSDCDIQGHWVSEAAGGLFVLPGVVFKGKEVPIERMHAHDRVHNGFMNFKDWNTTLVFPYANSSQYIIINGWNYRDKLVATFLGECRYCRQREILQGNWLIVSHSRNCESLGTTAKLISDVFRRDNIETLSAQHLQELKGKKNKKTRPRESIAHPESVSVSSGMPENPTMWTDAMVHNNKKNKASTPLHIKLH